MPPEKAWGGPWIVASAYARDGFRVVALAGELDVTGAPQLRGLLAEQLEPGPHLVVVDMTAVTFADSSALGALVAGRRRASVLGGMLRVAVPPGHRVARTLGLVGLDKLFEVYATVEDAVTMPVIPTARTPLED